MREAVRACACYRRLIQSKVVGLGCVDWGLGTDHVMHTDERFVECAG